jgi:hypothetical protein
MIERETLPGRHSNNEEKRGASDPLNLAESVRPGSDSCDG